MEEQNSIYHGDAPPTDEQFQFRLPLVSSSILPSSADPEIGDTVLIVKQPTHNLGHMPADFSTLRKQCGQACAWPLR